MRRVLSHPEFRLLWLSQAISTVGDRIVMVVLALYVNKIGSPTDVGIVLAAHAIPFAGLLLIGGVWADRLPRHRLMMSTDLIRGVLHGVLAILILAGHAPIWAIVAIEVGFGAAEAFFRPAYTGLVPQTVPDDQVAQAQAVSFLTSSISGFVGPAIGSGLYLVIGGGGAFAIDAATFFVSAALLVRVRPRERGEPAPRESVLAELRGGFDELRRRPWAGIIIASACWSLLLAVAPFQALGPAIADKNYDHAAIFGLVSAFSGAGAMAGAALAARWRAERTMLIASVVLLPWSLLYVCFGIGVPFALVAVVSFAGGVGIGLFTVWWESALVADIPPAALSRVSAFDWMGSLGLLPLGYLIAGPIGAAIGVRETLIAGGIAVTVLQLVVIASPPIRRFRQPKSGTPDSGVEASA